MSTEAQQLKAQGNAAFSKGDNQEAVTWFTKAIALDPTDHVFFSNRSAAYAAMSDYDNALKDAESCVKLAPTWAKGYSRLGLALFNLKKYDDAKKVMLAKQSQLISLLRFCSGLFDGIGNRA
jgi:stress-induced-phosphoprotein 1